MVIDDEFRGLCFPLQPDEYSQLRANLLRDGCRDPLVVWEQTDILLDGHNRYDLCGELNLPFQEVTVQLPDREAARNWVIRNQFGRRNLTHFQRAELALKLAPSVTAKAKANLRTATVGTRGGSPSQNSEKAIDTYKEVAKDAGISHDTLAKAKFLDENADEDTKHRLRKGATTIHAEYTRLKREEKERQRELRRAENAQQLTAVPSLDEWSTSGCRFATIVCDPPWDWGDEGDSDQFGRARPTYCTLSFEQILDLPVDKLADADSHLYLWITNRSLPKGFALLERWGFRYVTAITWCKPSIGLGNYFRGSTEHVLFGVRGSQPLNRRDVGTWFQARRGPLGHSSKPNEFYDMVESCSPGPYLEMFARRNRPGWASWGAEISGN